MFPPIYSIAASWAQAVALLGSPFRLYLFGEATQNTAKPYAVWQTIGGSPENYLKGRPDGDTWTCQVDVYATTAQSVRAVATALRDAWELSAQIVRWGGESMDPATKLYRYSFDVEFVTPR